MLEVLLKTAYLLVPAYFANMAPVLVKPIFPFLDSPLDGGAKYKGKQVLGNNKTWRGLIAAIFTGILCTYLQYYYGPLEWLLFDYTNYSQIGFALGFGAIAGDAVKSFFKRRRNIKPGHDWFPFDQIDFTVGAFIALTPIHQVPLLHAVILIIASALGQMLVKKLGYFLDLR